MMSSPLSSSNAGNENERFVSNQYGVDTHYDIKQDYYDPEVLGYPRAASGRVGSNSRYMDTEDLAYAASSSDSTEVSTPVSSIDSYQTLPPLLSNAERFANLTGAINPTNPGLLARIHDAQSLNSTNIFIVPMSFCIACIAHVLVYVTASDPVVIVVSFFVGALYVVLAWLTALLCWQKYSLATLRWDFDQTERKMLNAMDVYSDEYIHRRADALWAGFASLEWYTQGTIDTPRPEDIV